MGAKFLRGVRMGLLAARGTCKLSVVAHAPSGCVRASEHATLTTTYVLPHPVCAGVS